MKTNVREAMSMRNLAETRETKLGCAMGVDVVRQSLAHLSSQRCQQPAWLWHADHAQLAQPGGKPKGKPADGRADFDPRAPRAGRSVRLLGVSPRRLANNARRAVFGRSARTISLLALANGRSAWLGTACYSGVVHAG